MRNAGLDELQTGIKMGRRSINHLGYVGDTALMEESKEELKSFIMRVKKEGKKANLKLNIKKENPRSWHPVPSLHGKQKGKMWEK